jgi:hypothetical protein
MPDDGTKVRKPATADTSATLDETRQERSDRAVEPPSQSAPEGRRWLRPVLFMALPLALNRR